MGKIRIDDDLKKELDKIKIMFLKEGKIPPSYSKILRIKLKGKQKKGLLYDETHFF